MLPAVTGSDAEAGSAEAGSRRRRGQAEAGSDCELPLIGVMREKPFGSRLQGEPTAPLTPEMLRTFAPHSRLRTDSTISGAKCVKHVTGDH